MFTEGVNNGKEKWSCRLCHYLGYKVLSPMFVPQTTPSLLLFCGVERKSMDSVTSFLHYVRISEWEWFYMTSSSLAKIGRLYMHVRKYILII